MTSKWVQKPDLLVGLLFSYFYSPRSYAIQRDSLFILNGPTYVAGNGVTVGTSYQGNTYGLTKEYSLDGKDSVLTIPIPSGGGNVIYTYRTDNGALATVTDPSGNWFRYTYAGAGRVDSLLIGPSGGGKSIWETHVYDADGRQTRRIRATAGAPLFDESFWFDAQGRPTKVGRSTAANGVSPDTSHFVYSGLGAVEARERIGSNSFAKNQRTLPRRRRRRNRELGVRRTIQHGAACRSGGRPLGRPPSAFEGHSTFSR